MTLLPESSSLTLDSREVKGVDSPEYHLRPTEVEQQYTPLPSFPIPFQTRKSRIVHERRIVWRPTNLTNLPCRSYNSRWRSFSSIQLEDFPRHRAIVSRLTNLVETTRE